MNNKKRGAGVLAYNCSNENKMVATLNALCSIVDILFDFSKVLAIFILSYWFFASAAFAERGYIGGLGGEVIAAGAVTALVAWILQ